MQAEQHKQFLKRMHGQLASSSMEIIECRNELKSFELGERRKESIAECLAAN